MIFSVIGASAEGDGDVTVLRTTIPTRDGVLLGLAAQNHYSDAGWSFRRFNGAQNHYSGVGWSFRRFYDALNRKKRPSRIPCHG